MDTRTPRAPHNKRWFADLFHNSEAVFSTDDALASRMGPSTSLNAETNSDDGARSFMSQRFTRPARRFSFDVASTALGAAPNPGAAGKLGALGIIPLVAGASPTIDNRRRRLLGCTVKTMPPKPNTHKQCGPIDVGSFSRDAGGVYDDEEEFAGANDVPTDGA